MINISLNTTRHWSSDSREIKNLIVSHAACQRGWFHLSPHKNVAELQTSVSQEHVLQGVRIRIPLFQPSISIGPTGRTHDSDLRNRRQNLRWEAMRTAPHMRRDNSVHHRHSWQRILYLHQRRAGIVARANTPTLDLRSGRRWPAKDGLRTWASNGTRAAWYQCEKVGRVRTKVKRYL